MKGFQSVQKHAEIYVKNYLTTQLILVNVSVIAY